MCDTRYKNLVKVDTILNVDYFYNLATLSREKLKILRQKFYVIFRMAKSKFSRGRIN